MIGTTDMTYFNAALCYGWRTIQIHAASERFV